MKTVLVILMLSGGGHWFGGEGNRLTAQWAAATGGPDAVLTWQVSFAGKVVGEGEQAMPDGADPLTLSITLPKVHAVTAMDLDWQVRHATERDKIIAGGRRVVTVYPQVDGAHLKQLLEGRRVTVVGDEPLLAYLTAAEVTAEAGTLDTLSYQTPDLLVVGAGAIQTPVARDQVRNAAASGARVWVHPQAADPPDAMVRGAARWRLVGAPTEGTWRVAEPFAPRLAGVTGPLAARSDPFGSRAVGEGVGGPAPRSVVLDVDAADKAVLPLIYVSPTPGAEAPPRVRAAVALEAAGEGRILWWQVPTGDPARDPRVQQSLLPVFDLLCDESVATTSFQVYLKALQGRKSETHTNRGVLFPQESDE